MHACGTGQRQATNAACSAGVCPMKYQAQQQTKTRTHMYTDRHIDTSLFLLHRNVMFLFVLRCCSAYVPAHSCRMLICHASCRARLIDPAGCARLSSGLECVVSWTLFCPPCISSNASLRTSHAPDVQLSSTYAAKQNETHVQLVATQQRDGRPDQPQHSTHSTSHACTHVM